MVVEWVAQRVGNHGIDEVTIGERKDSNDADASIGIGLRGQSTSSEMGAGWTQYFASGAGTCSANSMTYKTVWLWVK